MIVGVLAACGCDAPDFVPARSGPIADMRERPIVPGGNETGTDAGNKIRSITLATTTSTQDSGLLDEFLPRFHRETGIEIRVVAVGSGQALELGRRGDVDVLIVHSPAAELQFMEEGNGASRVPLMSNSFVLVGPARDPARVRGQPSVAEALRRIADLPGIFVSRGDRSGTHVKELSLWQEAARDTRGTWYLRGGSGMAETLRLAAEKSAYTLSDRATYLAERGRLDLEILVAGDELLQNSYSVIAMNRAKFPNLNHEGVSRFIAFLRSQPVRALIAEFGRDEHGEPLFVPAP